VERVTDGEEVARTVREAGIKPWEYFTMLLGHPGVEADTMINRFVSDAIGVKAVDAERAHAAVIDAAQILDVQAPDLDHAIWRHRSGRPVRR
jgi:hypothetical protein